MYVLTFYYLDCSGDAARTQKEEPTRDIAQGVAEKWCREGFWIKNYHIAPGAILGCDIVKK